MKFIFLQQYLRIWYVLFEEKKIFNSWIKYIAFIEFSLKTFTFPSRGTCLGWKPNLNSMKWEFDELRIRWNENSMSCEFDELRILWTANRWSEKSVKCDSMRWDETPPNSWITRWHEYAYACWAETQHFFRVNKNFC